MKQEPQAWSRVDGIDLLRGLAIFFVLMNHVNMRLLGAKVPYTKGLPAQMVTSLVWNGQLGVQMFFVVSGFLIMAMSLRRWGSPGAVHVRDFYGMRVARIAPLLLALVTVLCVMHAAGVEGFVVRRATGGLGRAVVAALTFHINWLEATRGYLPAAWDILWSLSVEEVFYLFFPLVMLVCRRAWMLYGVLAVLVMVGPLARMKALNPNPVWREYSYLGGMDAIAMGCAVALLLAGKKLPRTWMHASGVAGAVLLVFSFCFSLKAYAWGLVRSGLSMTVLGVGTALVIAWAAQTEWRAPRIFTPLLMLGRRSYEIYLTHIFVVMALFAWFVKAGKPMGAVWWMFAAVIVGAGVLGEVVAVGYSERMNARLRERLRVGG
ncbi:MAG: acyltransferase [Edaphobacter sp.]|uniref:acyltransferase family protein n=1 Tax=Edaphobacter sp. TaxID=1934404 RepID=UPI0023A3C108|nr:acyltransferase [Edaphobacter sp.]MDE1175924.1 acyltransferase [Edaphobacter sp.]